MLLSEEIPLNEAKWKQNSRQRKLEITKSKCVAVDKSKEPKEVLLFLSNRTVYHEVPPVSTRGQCSKANTTVLKMLSAQIRHQVKHT